MSKGTAESAKNFKNISHTVSVRQQMRMASVYYNGMFDPDMKLPDNVKTKAALAEDSALKPLMDEEDIVCAEVDLNCQKYRSGDIVVLEAFDRDHLKVGVIQTILVRDTEVYLILLSSDTMLKDTSWDILLPIVLLIMNPIFIKHPV